MREYLKDNYKIILWCALGCLFIALILLVFLGLIALIPGVDLTDTIISENIIKINAASIIFLTVVLIAVAWLQLGALNKTSRADFLLRIDDRYSSPEIIKARITIQELYRKTSPSGQGYSEDDVTKRIADEIQVLGKETSSESCEKFVYLLNLLDFLETISYFSNKGYVSVKEINELLGCTITFNYKVFQGWIKYRRDKYNNQNYYCELESLVKKIDKPEID